MSIEQPLQQSFLLGRQRLLAAREWYLPVRGQVGPAAAFAAWAERLSVQPELVCARELAGLSNEQLSALEAEFVGRPLRPAAGWLRKALRGGVVVAAVGAVLLASEVGAAALGLGGSQVLQLLGVLALLGGVLSAAIVALSNFASVQLDLAWGRTGLYAGRLDEQHPWLYDASLLLRHPAAEAYRQQVLRERGELRGVDVILLRERVRSQEAVERTQWARTVAESLQRPAPVVEPRLVQVGARHGERRRADDASLERSVGGQRG